MLKSKSSEYIIVPSLFIPFYPGARELSDPAWGLMTFYSEKQQTLFIEVAVIHVQYTIEYVRSSIVVCFVWIVKHLNIIIFLQNTHKRHSITRPLWVYSLILYGAFHIGTLYVITVL